MPESAQKYEVLYKDRAAFERKKARLVAAGAGKLQACVRAALHPCSQQHYPWPHRQPTQVIADFDRTLSSLWHAPGQEGRVNLSCHAVCEHYSKFPRSYKEQSQELFQHYFPIEMSHDIPFEEKYKLCQEWWQKVCVCVSV